MTPTLLGRWQTRVLLLLTVGNLVSLPFAWGFLGHGSAIYFWVVFYVGFIVTGKQIGRAHV